MLGTVVQLLIFETLCCLSWANDDIYLSLSCTEAQKAFRGSCYEFVGRQLSFSSAQSWCEERGGHLVFVPDEDTQIFLQTHLDPKIDTWLGAAASVCSDFQDSAAVDGMLSWLDGSHITYSNWVKSPLPDAACGLIKKNSGFQWTSTKDCNQDLFFICQFESKRSIVCAGRNISLHCPSAQVLVIDRSSFGRKSNHYCQTKLSALKRSSQHQCGWVDVSDSLTAQCQLRQVCHLAGVMNSWGEPCPRLGSYLSVDYHCKDALTLTVSGVAAVFNDITISVKWLFRVSWGKPACRLSTGDGHAFDMDSPDGWDSTVVHKYLFPSTFTISLDCARGDMHVTAHKMVAILEPISDISVTHCYVGKNSFYTGKCKALFGEALKIQMDAEAGSNISYKIKGKEMVLAVLTVDRGNVPQNITLTPEIIQHLGPGCHQLKIYASNLVTFHEVSIERQVCVVAKVAGLQASMLKVKGNSLDSGDISVAVSLERGAPVVLLFSLTRDNHTFHTTREMNVNKGVFHIEHPIQGIVRMKVKAKNDFSSLEVDVDMFSSRGSNDHWLTYTPSLEVRHKRLVRSSSLEIKASPSASVDKRKTINLSITDASALTDTNERYQWECSNPCKCGGTEGLTHEISSDCVPEPFEFNRYHFNVIRRDNNVVTATASVCITLTPSHIPFISLSCTSGCDPLTAGTDVKIKMSCWLSCQKYVWNIEDPRDDDNWPTETKSCYKETQTRPLIERQDGGTTYTVRHDHLTEAMSKNQDVTVVVTKTGNTVSFYKKYTIKTSSTTTTTAPTTRTPAASDMTTKADVSIPAPNTPLTPPAPPAPNTPLTPAPITPLTPEPTTPLTTTSTSSSSMDLSCSISPALGTVLDAFNITCRTAVICPDCQYCFTTGETHLRCSMESKVTFMYLPVGDSRSDYSLMITATAKSGSFVVSTTITARVEELTLSSGSTVDDLRTSVENAVARLKEQGLLSGASVGQILASVSNILNSHINETTQTESQMLREQMLDILIDAMDDVPLTMPEEVQVIARSLTAISGAELNTFAQEKAALLFVNLSSSLLHMNVNTSKENNEEVYATASIIVEGVSNVMSYSSTRNTSDALISVLRNVQSALLLFKSDEDGPTTIEQKNIGVFAVRMNIGSLLTKSIHFSNCSCPSFSLAALPSFIFPSEELVDVGMLSLHHNPFSWNGGGNISGAIGDLSISTTNGSVIPVENLSADIEILLPRPPGEQVNATVLDLGNYSTLAIDVPSADSTLLFKMVPSEDPLPCKLYLGHMSYPTEDNYVAMTEIPLPGTTQEERYSWILDPQSFMGETGVYYLVVKPIVGPGIKSINATLSVTPINAACKFWNESMLEWSDKGCKVGVNTTHLVTQCLCNHLTFFGSSFFVTPNLIDPSRSAELFATFADNPVVVCLVGALSVAYLLALVWARRKDIMDTAKVKVTVLEDNNPVDEYSYLISVSTGHRTGASTSSQVTLTLLGADQNSEPHHLKDPKKSLFERGAVDVLLLTTPIPLGDLQGIRLWHNNSGSHPAWFVGNITVQDMQTNQKWYFLCNSWLAIDVGDCSLDKMFPVATEMDLKGFSNLFFMKTVKDLSDGHLWYSVLSRPPSSTFTCAQRVSCCFSLLLCTMLTSLMFYGIPADPSEQTMDLGHFEFSWQQFMIGVQSSLVMFPVNFLIVSVFRHTRPWEMSCCKGKQEKSDSHKHGTLANSSSPTVSSTMNTSDTLNRISTDITRVGLSLSQVVKSNPCAESQFDLEQENINAVLSAVEDFVRAEAKSKESPVSKTLHTTVQPQLPGNVAGVNPEANTRSKKTQYLYRQLCCIEKELSVLESSNASAPQSFYQALKQVQGIKGFLEDELAAAVSVNADELTQKKLSPAAETDGDADQKKMCCCHTGFPWWFVFVGWLLVAATSCIAGYFTMLYGLKFGKERSISWLVSMLVSFFQSILVIQPLKVLCFAAFFALVIKRVDEEDYQNMPFTAGDGEDQQRVSDDKTLYLPPPPADVERMKRNKIIEQKAFSLLREIFIYIGFMWMLLLVAYGQRDSNAFLLNRHVRRSFGASTTQTMGLGDMFHWANTTLLSNLFGLYPGFITDGKSKLVGNARLRQLRVQQKSCQTAAPVLHSMPGCNAPYSWEVEDMGFYDTGWTDFLKNNISVSTPTPWVYQTQTQLRAYPVWGKMFLYRGGGFVAELGPDLNNASRTLDYLFRNKWLDEKTRALFVEFTIYNANVNLFCIATLLFETTAIGAFHLHSELRTIRLYQSTGNLHVFVIAAEVIYLLFILYYMFQQGKLMKQQRWTYFRSKWNLLELSIIILTWGAVAVFIKKTLLGKRDLTFYQDHKDQFASFYESATADSQLQYLIAFLVLLATVKLWRLLRINPKMNLIVATLHRAWTDISGLLMIVAIMLIAYSVACNVLYGWMLSSYRTFADALLTVISLQMGIFNYDEVFNYNSVLGGLLIGSCIMFMTFVVLNLLISGILMAFQQEQMEHVASEEKEIVDLLLRKIYNFLGIRHADVNVKGSGDVTLNY